MLAVGVFGYRWPCKTGDWRPGLPATFTALKASNNLQRATCNFRKKRLHIFSSFRESFLRTRYYLACFSTPSIMQATKKRILIAEPDPDTRFIVGTALTKAGYVVETKAAATTVLEERNSWPDLFILDRDLPTIDGLAICKYLRVKKDTQRIPIILVSTYAIRNKAVQAGATEFIQKPFEMKALLQSVRKYTSNH